MVLSVGVMYNKTILFIKLVTYNVFVVTIKKKLKPQVVEIIKKTQIKHFLFLHKTNKKSFLIT